MRELVSRAYASIVRKYESINMICSTYLCYIKAYLKNIDISKECRFYGCASFNKGRSSVLKIGNNCQFRSSETSNNMGLNHRCIISSTNWNRGGQCINGQLIIGNNCGFSGVSIWCFKSILIGNGVRVGANTLIMDGDAHPEDPRSSDPSPIVIEDNVFIGANCVIKKGVTIGKNSVIGMNSVVTKSIPENCVAVGCPARVLRTL